MSALKEDKTFGNLIQDSITFDQFVKEITSSRNDITTKKKKIMYAGWVKIKSYPGGLEPFNYFFIEEISFDSARDEIATFMSDYYEEFIDLDDIIVFNIIEVQ